MNKLISIFLVLVVITGCGLFNTGQDESKTCDEQFFEEIRSKKSLPISITYDIRYSNEENLSEEKVLKQRERIKETHAKFLKSLEGFEFSSVRKSDYFPWISMFVNDEKTLSFVCSNKLVLDVRKTEFGSPY
ncbi:hypothetical protein [Gracilimonas mengyeensis]|uniref:Lipoprotein n=1 Tax=Gracilimonas mengyeensis TaxID=1302730 RepID=A0A521CUG7_9BACT|nr:hypothetical protein [Gracilimonas mengyeensis]SMO63099.1 hypothetical protein SAMN06265219_106114 [Gracilimonas mengyeensis]